MKHFACLLSALSSFLILFLNTAFAEYTSEDCKNCHSEIQKKALVSVSQHSVARDKCIICHVSNESGLSNPDEGGNLRSVTSHSFMQEVVFPLENLKKSSQCQIEIVASDQNGMKSASKVLPINPLDVAEAAFSPIKSISGLMVESVKGGVFVKASLFWLTDAPATTEVEYGLSEDSKNRLPADGHYTREHRISIAGLQSGRKYYFRAVSKDIFGNIVRSGEQVLNTSEFFSKKDDARVEKGIIPVISKAEVFNVEKQGLFLAVSINKPSRIKMTIFEKADDKEKSNHSFLPKKYSTITACIKCHKQGASHPVGVRARGPDIRIPDFLPTIENGMVTCVTCHEPHGSKHTYLTRFNFGRALCIKCHINDTYL